MDHVDHVPDQGYWEKATDLSLDEEDGLDHDGEDCVGNHDRDRGHHLGTTLGRSEGRVSNVLRRKRNGLMNERETQCAEVTSLTWNHIALTTLLSRKNGMTHSDEKSTDNTGMILFHDLSSPSSSENP